jgi:hypothetical protein
VARNEMACASQARRFACFERLNVNFSPPGFVRGEREPVAVGRERSIGFVERCSDQMHDLPVPEHIDQPNVPSNVVLDLRESGILNGGAIIDHEAPRERRFVAVKK